MTGEQLRDRLTAAGWDVVDLPRHHGMIWTAIHADMCVTLRRDGTVTVWVHARNSYGTCEIHMTGHPAAVAVVLETLGAVL
jgi:hypothetical protein